jgi:flagellin
MLEKAVASAATLGALQQRVDMQADLNNSFMDSIDSGVSRLVDADMEESSAKLAALQTQQQLAVQSLQISNSSPDNILQLFR